MGLCCGTVVGGNKDCALFLIVCATFVVASQARAKTVFEHNFFAWYTAKSHSAITRFISLIRVSCKF